MSQIGGGASGYDEFRRLGVDLMEILTDLWSVAALGSVWVLVPALVAGGGGMEGSEGGLKSRKTKVNTAPLFLSIYFPILFFFVLGGGGGGVMMDSSWLWARFPVEWALVSGCPLGVLSVCALVSDNNPNHFSPMLSPPARSGRYTTSAVFAS